MDLINNLGTLYIVATPIGNLGDMSFRALETLQSVDLIAAEDTRRSAGLLTHYGIKTRTLSLHDHNEQTRSVELMKFLSEGSSVALISDAGTPLVSDPGYCLVKMAREHGIMVIAIPGPCAAILGLVVSGMPTDRFIFEGFLPVKAGKRKKRLQVLCDETRTLVLYESVHRIMRLLNDLITVFGDERLVSIGRELTKTFETTYVGSLSSVRDRLLHKTVEQKGEFVLVLQGCSQEKRKDHEEARRVLSILLRECSVKQAVHLACQITEESRKMLYPLALELERELEQDLPEKRK